MKTVLHVLPHPGGGGETYVDSLSAMTDYRFERYYLAPTARPRDALVSLSRKVAALPVEARKYDLIHVEGEVAAALSLPTLALRPSVVTLNGLHLLRRTTGLCRTAARANLRLMLACSSRVICVSESEHADLIDAVGGRFADRAVQINNGVLPLEPATAGEREAARAAYGIAPGATVAAWLAGLDEHKDPRTAVLGALQVAQEGALFVLLVAGDGPLRPELEQRARASGTDAVRILGFRRDTRQVLAAADLFVLSSQREGLSFSLLEAMSMGLPAVVSDGAGNPDAVGDAGIVVPFGDVHGFAHAYDRLGRDELERARLGARARERVLERFTADEMVQRTRDVYEGALAEHRPN